MTTSLLRNPRFVYRFDAVASLTLGVALMLLSPTLTQLAGWTLPSSFLFGVGVFLLPWAAFNLWVGLKQPVLGAALVHVLVDGAWVLGSALLIVMHAQELTTLGVALLGGQAFAVAGVLALKAVGLTSLRAAA
ncbi:hypothetical protein [Corallococcus macrosporus]|uniref:Uncharacterized protein n=1 Tax=Corallococcus macrosporus DSM 14697 TaxID=1189310 RepID=A0A250K492_9BACT|nr:hypothetical protein [Corallococcus macrosporus]ATB50833.1 hypothetical protein MYMAC_006490 [Corallococcus macrosporus DSM 14697]